MNNRQPTIRVKKLGSHSEDPPEGIELPVRQALIDAGFCEGSFELQVRMVHAPGNSHNYRGAHFKCVKGFASNVLEVVSQPGSADTAFPCYLIVPPPYDAEVILQKVRGITVISPDRKEDAEELQRVAQFDLGSAAAKQKSEPVESRRQKNASRERRFSAFWSRATNIDMVGTVLEGCSLNGIVPRPVLDRAIRTAYHSEMTPYELALARAFLVLNAGLLEVQDDSYHFTERGHLWIESLRQKRLRENAQAKEIRRHQVILKLDHERSSLERFVERTTSELKARRLSLIRLETELQDLSPRK